MSDENEPGGRGGWTRDEIVRVGHGVVDVLARYLTELPNEPVFRPVPVDAAERFASEPLPRIGSGPDAILAEFAERIAPHPFGNGHPRFFGWVNSPPDMMGIFAELLAAAMNPSCAGGNHAPMHLERQVVRWVAELLGMPERTGGLLVSGGSTAALTALAVARHVGAGYDVRREGVGRERGRMLVYKTDEGHGCYQKAVELLGLGHDALRIVESNASLRMVPSSLEAALREDRDRGDLPIAVVASAGTVNTGAIDPLDAIADVCQQQGVWMHVDGAYGAPAVLSDAYRDALAPIARADSVAIDPHKWLYVPVECGLVLVRDMAAMRDTFSLVPPYLRTEDRPGGVSAGPWLSEFGFQQTRGFRSLKLWMALKSHGRDGYKAAIEHDIDMARALDSMLRGAGDFEVWTPQGLSIVAFRYAPRGLRGDPEALDAINRRVCEAVQLGGRAFVSSTILGGRFYLRACVVNPLARREDVAAVVDAVRAAGVSFAGPSD